MTTLVFIIYLGPIAGEVSTRYSLCVPPSFSLSLSHFLCLPASLFGHYINPIHGHLSSQRRLDQPLLLRGKHNK